MMGAACFENHINATPSFELFVRTLPRERTYLLVAGPEQALDFLETLEFKPVEIDFLRRHPVFRPLGDRLFDCFWSNRWVPMQCLRMLAVVAGAGSCDQGDCDLSH